MEDSKVYNEDGEEDNVKQEYNDFYEAHSLQLYGMGFPSELGEKLYYKLKYEVFDSSRYFEIVENQEESKFALNYAINNKETLKRNSEIFLVDHSWTFKLRQFNYFCEKFPQIIDRVYNMLKYSHVKREVKTEINLPSSSNSRANYLDYDNKNITNLDEVILSEQIEAISLEDNKISDFNSILEFLSSKGSKIKAIWLEGNAFTESLEGYDLILENTFPSLELINRKFTKNAGEWAFQFIQFTSQKRVNKYDSLYGRDDYLDFSNRDPLKLTKIDAVSKLAETVKVLDISGNDYEYNCEDKIFSNKILQFLSLFPKLETLIVDEHESDYMYLEVDEDSNSNKNFVSFFRHEIVSEYLRKNLPNLKFINDYSLKKLLDKNTNFSQYHKECRVRNYIWKMNHTYRLVTSEKYDEDATWYINDEFGTAINHSDQANVALFPFIFSPSNKFKDDMITYSILWPLKDIKKGDEVTRDFLTNISESMQRSARLTTWFDTPKIYFLNKFYSKMETYTEASLNYNDKITKYLSKLKVLKDAITDSQLFDEIYSSTFNFETLENSQVENLYKVTKENIFTSLSLNKYNKYFIDNFVEKGIKIKVYSDLAYVRDNLKSHYFEITEDVTSADILWLNMLYYKLDEAYGANLKNIRYKNQFPFENVVTMKNHLTDLVQNNMGMNTFLNLSYNMVIELAEIIGNFYYNESNNFDNSWILKPVNMTRSMDMIVTNNLDEIIRNVETGPKICQKYLHNPFLLNKKKFDLRFIILLKSLVPLDLYFYSKMFWIRSANKDFTMDKETFSDYEVHFTVMNYNTYGMQTIYDKQFLEYLKTNNVEWDAVYHKIKMAVKNIFILAGKDCPQMNDPNSRAIYGIDAMIDDNLEAKILEINFSPDCTRACKFVPEFYDDIFSTLFLDNNQGVENISDLQ